LLEKSLVVYAESHVTKDRSFQSDSLTNDLSSFQLYVCFRSRDIKLNFELKYREKRGMGEKRLGEKLLQIRETLELSQSEILRYMGLDEQYSRNIISNYEKDHREPPLFVLLGYARLAGICLDAIVDDDVDVPKKLPATPKHRGVKIPVRRPRASKR